MGGGPRTFNDECEVLEDPHEGRTTTAVQPARPHGTLMTRQQTTARGVMFRKHAALGLIIVTLLIVCWALLAPRERVLGSSIRIVYLHVATTWAGLTGIYIAGLLGAALAARPRRKLEVWLRSVSWTGLGLYAAGFALSLLAAKISWGGIVWAEPRVVASLRIVGLGILVLAIIASPLNRRLKGLLWAALAAYSAWTLRSAGLYFHPEQPISVSPSVEIKAAFYGLFVLTLAAGSMIVWLMQPAAGQNDRTS